MAQSFEIELKLIYTRVVILGVIDLMEFLKIPLGELKLYLHKLGLENPFVQSRNSNQTWLWHYGAYSELLESFHERWKVFQ